MDAEEKVRAKRYWVGIADGKIDFFSDRNYYGGVVHADLFKTRAAAKLCYEEVRQVTLRTPAKRKAGRMGK